MSDRMLLRLPLSAPAVARRRMMGGGLSWENIRAAWRRYRSRQRIAELDGHILKDIGVTFAEAEHEANKPFWR
jgi:uncharacterized protein YjiS (DUF1127 family)